MPATRLHLWWSEVASGASAGCARLCCLHVIWCCCTAWKAHACFVASLHLLCFTRNRFVFSHWLLTLSSMQVASFSLGTAGAEMATVIQRCKDIECLLADILPPEHVLRQPGQAAHAADSDHAQKLLEDLAASGIWQSCMACLQSFFRCSPATLAKPVDYPI